MRFPLLLLLSFPAAAQHLGYGFQVGASQPLDDLGGAVSKTGVTLGFRLPIDFSNGHQIRPRFDVAGWESHRTGYMNFGPAPADESYQKASSAWLGADYVYHVSRSPEGMYFLVGLGVQRVSFKDERDPDNPNFGGYVKYLGNGTAPSYALGLGHEHGLFGVELRYTHSQPSIGGASVAVSTLNLSASFCWGR